MTLKNYYQNLPPATAPKSALMKEIMLKCGVTQQTAHSWLTKDSLPASKDHCDVIAEITGIPVDELFPSYSEKHLTANET